VATGIAFRRGIHAEQQQQLYVQRGFLAGLANRGRLDAFPDIDKTARDRPAKRGMAALDQHDWTIRAVGQLNDDVRCQQRGYRGRHLHPC